VGALWELQYIVRHQDNSVINSLNFDLLLAAQVKQFRHTEHESLRQSY
jgi:hypothetical protein